MVQKQGEKGKINASQRECSEYNILRFNAVNFCKHAQFKEPYQSTEIKLFSRFSAINWSYSTNHELLYFRRFLENLFWPEV